MKLIKKILLGMFLIFTSSIVLFTTNVIALSMLALSALSFDYYAVICLGLLGISAYLIATTVERLARQEHKRSTYKNFWFPLKRSKNRMGGRKWWLQA